MKSGRVILVSLFCCVISACAGNQKLEGIPLVWKPKVSLAASGAVETSALSQQSITVAPFQDRRANPELIGENRENKTPLAVTTSDNVAAFVTRKIADLLSQSGMNVVESGAGLVMRGEVISFFVTETGTYVGDVRVRLSVGTPRDRVAWQGIVGGTAEHFGRSYRDENYYETLSDSLVHLVENLFHDPDFRKAVAASSLK